MSSDNKLFVSKMQEILKTKGYDVKTSHLYDAFAQMAGFKNWHVASAQNADLTKVISKFKTDVKAANVLSESHLKKITNELIDSSMKIFKFNLFNPELPSWNHSIVGPTGSGKSVLVGKILSTELMTSPNAMVGVIDRGGESIYSKMADVFNGSVIKVAKKLPNINLFDFDIVSAFPKKKKIAEISSFLSQKNPEHSVGKMEIWVSEYYTQLSNNGVTDLLEKESIFNQIFPFELKKEYLKILDLKLEDAMPSKKQLDLIVGVINLICKSIAIDLNNKLYDEDRHGYLPMILNKVYEEMEDKSPTFIDFYNALEKEINKRSPSELQVSFLSKLKEWTRDGRFSMFDQKTNISFENRFMVFDLSGLESNRVLQNIYTLLITNKMAQKLMYTKDCRKSLFIENIYVGFDCDLVRSQFIDMLSSSRKYGYALVSVTPMASDYFQNSSRDGDKIASYIDCNIIGKMLSVKICEETAGRLSLHWTAQKFLKEICERERSVSSNFVMVTRKDSKIFSNPLTEYESYLYSSSAGTQALFDYYLNVKRKFKKIEDVTEFLSNNGHLKDQELAEFLTNNGHINLARLVRG